MENVWDSRVFRGLRLKPKRGQVLNRPRSNGYIGQCAPLLVVERYTSKLTLFVSTAFVPVLLRCGVGGRTK